MIVDIEQSSQNKLQNALIVVSYVRTDLPSSFLKSTSSEPKENVRDSTDKWLEAITAHSSAALRHINWKKL